MTDVTDDKKSKKNLSDYYAYAVALVDEGANLKDRFFLIKSKEGKEMPISIKDFEGFQEIIKTALPDEQKLDDFIAKSKLSENATNALKGAARLLNGMKSEIGEDTLREVSAMVGFGFPKVIAKSKEETKPETKPESKPENFGAIPIKKDGSPDFDAVPEQFRTTAQFLYKQAKQKDDELVHIKKSLDEERDIRITREYETKADAYKNIPTDKKDIGLILKSVALKCPDQYEKLEMILKSANDIMSKKDITSETGTSVPNNTSGNPMDMIENAALALPIVKDKNLDKAAAVTHFITETPEGRKMYSEYMSARVKK